MRPRRLLPSPSLLAAFEAVLRTGSTAAAARDLGLSQGTVSRLVQNLETQLGRPLFERQRQRLLPTAAARAYGRDISRALDLIQRASAELASNPEGGVLSLAILPAFGTRWLAPRLAAFHARHPHVVLNLSTRLRRFDFRTASFDAAIHFGTDDWRAAAHLKLFDERLTACAAPAVLAARPIATPDDLADLPLLRLDTRPTAWETWFAGQGARPPEIRGMLFDQFVTMAQAAAAGLGLALLPDYLAEPEIREGRLAPVLRPAILGTGAYWLVWPLARADYAPLVAFRDWLRDEIAAPPPAG